MAMQGAWSGVYRQHVHHLLFDGVPHSWELLHCGRLVPLGAHHSVDGVIISMGEETLDTGTPSPVERTGVKGHRGGRGQG